MALKKVTLKRRLTAGDTKMIPKIKHTDIKKDSGGTAVDIYSADFIQWTNPANPSFMYADSEGYKHGYASVIRSAFSISIDDHAAIEHADFLNQIFADLYSAAVTYLQGQFVSYNGYVYRCKYDNTNDYTPTGTASSNIYWEYITTGAVSLQAMLNRMPSLTLGKVDLDIFDGVLNTEASMRFAGTATLSADEGNPTLLSDVFSALTFGSEEEVQQQKNLYFIVTTEGFITTDVDADQNCYTWSADVEDMDEPDSYTPQHLEVGDIIVFQHYVKDLPGAGYYTLGFGVINNTMITATTAHSGLVQLTTVGGRTSREELYNAQSNGLKVVDESVLKSFLKDIVAIQPLAGLSTGILRYFRSQESGLPTGANNYLALVGTGNTKTLYKHNGSVWETMGGTITLPNGISMRELYYDVVNDTYFRTSSGGLDGLFVAQEALDNDLLIEYEAVSLS